MPSWCSGSIDLDSEQPDFGKFRVEVYPKGFRRLPRGHRLLFMTGQIPRFGLRVIKLGNESEPFSVTLFHLVPSEADEREWLSMEIKGDTYIKDFEDRQIMLAGQYVYTVMISIGNYHKRLAVLSFEAKSNEDVFLHSVPIAVAVASTLFALIAAATSIAALVISLMVDKQ